MVPDVGQELLSVAKSSSLLLHTALDDVIVIGIGPPVLLLLLLLHVSQNSPVLPLASDLQTHGCKTPPLPTTSKYHKHIITK